MTCRSQDVLRLLGANRNRENSKSDKNEKDHLTGSHGDSVCTLWLARLHWAVFDWR